MLRVKKQLKVVRAVKGFHLPILEYEEDLLDIAEQIVIDADNTYYMQMDSDAMAGYGIFKGNILVVDKSLTAVEGAIVVTFFNGEWYVREYTKQGGAVLLKAGHPSASINVGKNDELAIWGVVMVNVNNLLPRQLMKGRYADVCTC